MVNPTTKLRYPKEYIPYAYYPVEILESIRKEHGLSMREMAKKCDVSASTYSRWISGKAHPDVLSLKHAHEVIADMRKEK